MVEFENMEQREVLETPNLEESPNEALDRKLRAYFDGKIVRKDLTKSIKEGANVPVYVLEFLLGQYCSSDDQSVIDEGIHNVKKFWRTISSARTRRRRSCPFCVSAAATRSLIS